MRPSPKTTTPPRYPFPRRPPWPPEHGAWFVLLINFVLGAALAPAFNIVAEIILFLTSLAFFPARHPILLIAMRWKYKHLQPGYFFMERIIWTIAWGGAGMCGALLLIGVYHGAILWPIALVWGISVLFEMAAVCARMQKTAVSEGWGMAALTLAAAASMSIGSERIVPLAWLLWALTLAYHLQAVFYVRMRIRSLSGKFSFGSWRQKLFFGRANLAMVFLIWTGLITTVAAQRLPAVVTITFVPMTVRALRGLTRLGQPTLIRRLGYSEVAFSLVFSALLFYTLGVMTHG